MSRYLWLGLLWALGLLAVPSESQAQKVISERAEPVKIIDGHQFTEGPYWQPGGVLLFSDIPANTIFKWSPGSDSAVIYLKPSGHSNGIAADKDGNLILAQHDGMISMVDADTTFHPLAKEFRGKRLNSPNDLTVRSDGSIYFTDPPFGVQDNEKELDINGVYRIMPDGELMLLYSDLEAPNGITFSPDESKLYVNDSATGRILVFDVTVDGNVSLPDEFSDEGGSDGMTVDKQGNLYSVGGSFLYIFNPQGVVLDKVRFPEQITNMCWAGHDGKTLYVTAASGVYKLATKIGGINR